MQRVSFTQIPCPMTGKLLSADILQDDEDLFYSRTSYPFEDEIMGPFGDIREVKEYLWSVYGRP